MMRITGTQKMISAMSSEMTENAAFCHGPNRALTSGIVPMSAMKRKTVFR